MGAKLSGGVLFSPWLNLPCDTPSYVSNAYKLEDVSTVGLMEKCNIPGLPHSKQVNITIGGDVAFTGCESYESCKYW